jgi:RNA-binding protein
MINSKQRAWLRAEANGLDCQFQIGKEEIDHNTVKALDEIMSTHELIKINVLKTAEAKPAEIAQQLASQAGADIVQVIGRRIVLYRFSEKLAKAGKNIVLPVR